MQHLTVRAEIPPLVTDEQVLIIVIGVLAAILVAVVGVWGTRRWLKRRQELRMLAMQIPDFGGDKPKPTLTEILSDPDIVKIEWSDIEIGERLGAGADGVVYRAVWAKENGEKRAVAVKRIYVAEDLEMVSSFLTEIKIASAMRHKNVMQVLGVSHVGETDLCLVTELAEHGSLRHVLDRKGENLPLAMRFYLAIGAARGLSFLHSRRVIHRCGQIIMVVDYLFACWCPFVSLLSNV